MVNFAGISLFQLARCSNAAQVEKGNVQNPPRFTRSNCTSPPLPSCVFISAFQTETLLHIKRLPQLTLIGSEKR